MKRFDEDDGVVEGSDCAARRNPPAGRHRGRTGVRDRTTGSAWHGEAETGLVWAALVARLRRSRRAMPIKDSLIAATAIVHDLTVVTRKCERLQEADLRVLNPFEDA
jgi:hypothetical protein